MVQCHCYRRNEAFYITNLVNPEKVWLPLCWLNIREKEREGATTSPSTLLKSGAAWCLSTCVCPLTSLPRQCLIIQLHPFVLANGVHGNEIVTEIQLFHKSQRQQKLCSATL